MGGKSKECRLGEERLNKQGCLMRVIKYNNANDIIVEFQDGYSAKVHTIYQSFLKGSVKNPYYPSVFGVGMIGNKYPVAKNWKDTKEYVAWSNIIERCFDKKFKVKHPTYKNVTCCNEWLCFENFYEWLHSQENFDKWLNGDRWAIDKDIIVKNNNVYTPETCCLVPMNVNSLFTKCDKSRGCLPIGVVEFKKLFRARCNNQLLGKVVHLGLYKNIEDAFNAYKNYKEDLIKQIAQIEWDEGNITQKCYRAMLKYVVEFAD